MIDIDELRRTIREGGSRPILFSNEDATAIVEELATLRQMKGAVDRTAGIAAVAASLGMVPATS